MGNSSAAPNHLLAHPISGLYSTPSMPGWTLVDTNETLGRTFQRPLSALEVCFLWDGFFNGTADNVHHCELSLPRGARDAHLFSDVNITRAWLSTKRRFPLAGAMVRGADGAPLQVKIEDVTDAPDGVYTGFASVPHFVVREHDLAILCPQEIEFGQVADAEEARRYAAGILLGPRPLSEELLTRLYVLRETDGESARVLHLIVVMAHCVTDGTAIRTFVRCLLDTLARGGAEPAQVPLEDRLASAIPWTDLQPVHLRALSPAVRRWRNAVGTVIYQLRLSKEQGGHTLPFRYMRSTWYTSARPGLVSTSITLAQTTTVIANCRLHGLTFGNVFPVLAQVAMTRVLYRRYLRGEISEEEWAYRRRQPYMNGAPLNLRRHLDKSWFDNGGGGEFMMCISLDMYRLPLMTLGTTTKLEQHQRILSDGAPPFLDLLAYDRFLHRARLVKKQSAALSNHPLLLEIIQAGDLDFVHYTRLLALKWMRHAETANGHADEDGDKILSPMDIPSMWAHGGSTLGNMDLMTPSEYPLPPTHPLSPYSPAAHPNKAGYVAPPLPAPPASEADTASTITVDNTTAHLHTRPAELYLGAMTSQGRMEIYVHYDENVFEKGVVKEWLDEVREAILWYLGRTTS